MGAGVIDADYRGEVGVILFNFSDTDFVVNMGDRIAQLILEKNKTPLVRELVSLEGTDRGGKGFGSTGMDAAEIINAGSNDERNNKQMKATPIAQSRQLINAQQMKKLAKADNPVYLAIVRKTDGMMRKRQRTKRTPTGVAQFAAAHGRYGNNEAVN